MEPIDELRAVVASTPPAPTEMSAYLGKVRERAYTVTDDDVETLREHFTEDEIFEQTVAAAIEQGLHRYDRAQKALE